MSEERIIYTPGIPTLLQPAINNATLEQQPTEIPDWLHLERMLLPLLNYARRKQGKKPVIVPKG